MEITQNQIKKAKESNIWSFGNQVLYNLCKESPANTEKDIVVAKLWLIGRSYSAAIERGATGNYDTTEAIYKFGVPKELVEVGKKLDDKICSLKNQGEKHITKELLPQIIETHAFLTDRFLRISGKNNRSLASKYLHFHAPEFFYIYDSKAVENVRKYKTLDEKLRQDLIKGESDTYDKDYVDFVAKMYPLNERIKNELGVWLTPRQLDIFLLKY